jgi:hypothetical protein
MNARRNPPIRVVAHALVRAASRLVSTHGVDLDTSAEAARKSAYATKRTESWTADC